MEIAYEAASIRDLGVLYEIEKQCFDKEAFTRQQIAYLLTDYNALGLVARVDVDVVGFIIGRVELGRSVHFGHIITLDVVPSYRRRGIAEQLLCRIETILGAGGVKEVRLEVREDNLAALGLYQKFGYKRIGKLEGYYGDSDGLYLKKNLA